MTSARQRRRKQARASAPRAIGANAEVRRLLVSGCVGEAAAHEYLRWTSVQDLPDPEALLAAPDAHDFTDVRADRVYVILQGVLGAVSHRSTPERWTAAVEVCARAAQQVGVDPAVPTVRALMRPDLKPAGAVVPSSISVFAAALALAGLLPAAPGAP